MTDTPDTITPPSIAALPPTTTRQIGSGQVLVDPSSVIKELIDNALDARAKSIFVDITPNTIDTIQVKDDGHGIPSEDRPLVCRRYCTSKIRDLQDLRDVGGKWLGFRGEALSSMADMSGVFSVTTRAEGEPVAVRLKYGRDGELGSVEHDSHPVGTTVKLTGFFDRIPVRKQTAVKNAAKCLAKIRRLMQAYALARPGIRLRFHVLKAKNGTGDFVYAPKADASVEDAVFKIMGRECASQCEWTATEADGFKIHACLLKPTADSSKISNQGSFVAVDARPVSSCRGTIKQMIGIYKERLRKVNTSLAGIKDPFVCINIICPPGSYDPNIEPAKDDVMFDDGNAVLDIFKKLLESYYSEAAVSLEDTEPPSSALQSYEPHPGDISVQNQEEMFPQAQIINEDTETRTSGAPQRPPKWRPNMYGIDEDDLEFLQNDRTSVVEEEEEEGRRAIEVSNPWTIARMNAPVKPKQSIGNVQLPSPAKSNQDSMRSSSPRRPATASRSISEDPLTPGISSRTDVERSVLDQELERSIQRLPRASSVASGIDDWTGDQPDDGPNQMVSINILEAKTQSPFLQPESQLFDVWALPSDQHASAAPATQPQVERSPNRRQPNQVSKPFKPPILQKKTANVDLPYFPADTWSKPQRRLAAAPEHQTENYLNSENNTDIRDFFIQGSKFTPINSHSQALVKPPFMGHKMSFISDKTPSPKRKPLERHHRETSTQSTQEITAYFLAHENATSASLPQRLPLGDSHLHKHIHTTPTKPAKRPVHRTPQKDQSTRNLVLNLHITIDAILRSTRRQQQQQQFSRTSLDTVGNESSVFSTDISKEEIVVWASRLDGMLCALYDRVDGVDVKGVLERGIEKLRRDEKGEGNDEFDMAEFVEFGDEAGEVGREGSDDEKDEEEDLEDDMLMDM